MLFVCHSCRKDIEIADRVGRRDECPHCGHDLHVCLNCRYYDLHAANECRETQAERVLEKDRANYCEYFSAGSAITGHEASSTMSARKALEDLFKRK